MRRLYLLSFFLIIAYNTAGALSDNPHFTARTGISKSEMMMFERKAGRFFTNMKYEMASAQQQMKSSNSSMNELLTAMDDANPVDALNKLVAAFQS